MPRRVRLSVPSWSWRRLALSLSSVLAAACLDVGRVPVGEPAPCFERSPDPLIGAWQRRGKPERICAFYENGRFFDECGLYSAQAADYARLEDERYYFGFVNSFGGLIGECIATAEYADTCDALTLDIECDHDGNPFTLRLERVTE